MEKKYELTNETLEYQGHVLHRIKALRNFLKVKVGDLGGWVEKEDNLSHEGTCWVYDDAMVFGDAGVFGDAMVFGKARVCDTARVFDYAKVFGGALVFCNANVYDDAMVFGEARVYGEAKVFGYAEIGGNASVGGNAQVYAHANVYDNAQIYDFANVCNFANVYGNAEICGNARVKSNKDYAVFKNFWSSGRYFTWTRSNNMWKVGCFYGTGEELIKKAYADSEISGKGYEAIVKAVESVK